jgi:hypothetical protein
VAPGGVELVEPIWSWASSSLVALCGVSSALEGIVAEAASRVRAKGAQEERRLRQHTLMQEIVCNVDSHQTRTATA